MWQLLREFLNRMKSDEVKSVVKPVVSKLYMLVDRKIYVTENRSMTILHNSELVTLLNAYEDELSRLRVMVKKMTLKVSPVVTKKQETK